MYRPPAFREDRVEVLHSLIEAHRLGLLVTGGAEGLVANLVPFTLDRSRGPNGTLRRTLHGPTSSGRRCFAAMTRL
jgi:transcriptional regulator